MVPFWSNELQELYIKMKKGFQSCPPFPKSNLPYWQKNIEMKIISLQLSTLSKKCPIWSGRKLFGANHTLAAWLQYNNNVTWFVGSHDLPSTNRNGVFTGNMAWLKPLSEAQSVGENRRKGMALIIGRIDQRAADKLCSISRFSARRRKADRVNCRHSLESIWNIWQYASWLCRLWLFHR